MSRTAKKRTRKRTRKETPTKTIVTAAVATVAFGAPLQASSSDHDEIPFAVAEVFFELNNTDGDLGIHALIDGEPWKELEIEDPREREILDVRVKRRLRRQGLTEIFFESAEPTFDELPPRRFFRRFPAGEYEIGGTTTGGEELESIAELTHLIPAPAMVAVNGEPMSEDCDDEEPGFAPTEVAAPVVIDWDAVTLSHGELGSPTSSPSIVIHNYQVVVETDVEVDGDELEVIFSAELPPGVTSMTVPAEFLALSDEFKYEVLAREESFNQTAVESCFVLVD